MLCIVCAMGSHRNASSERAAVSRASERARHKTESKVGAHHLGYVAQWYDRNLAIQRLRVRNFLEEFFLQFFVFTFAHLPRLALCQGALFTQKVPI